MKYAWIDAHRDSFALNERCDVLAVSVGGYRAWQGGGTPGRQGLTDATLLALIQSIHAGLKGAYGSPRMVRELRARGFSASKARLAGHLSSMLSSLRSSRRAVGIPITIPCASSVRCDGIGTPHRGQEGDSHA